jgi:UDPglucose--hexose-1-phosphate uridylyltransferase
VKDWEVRCFPNLYPALPEHEIIAENPDHEKHPSNFTDDEITLLMQVYSDRTTHHLKNNDTEYAPSSGTTAGMLAHLFRIHTPS